MCAAIYSDDHRYIRCASFRKILLREPFTESSGEMRVTRNEFRNDTQADAGDFKRGSMSLLIISKKARKTKISDENRRQFSKAFPTAFRTLKSCQGFA